MKFTSETKLFVGILVATIAIIVFAMMVLTKPTPTLSRDELVPPGAATKGNPTAKAYLVEFSDFQCPACLAVQPTVNGVTAQYKNQLVFVYRHFPLDQHPFGQKAAQAAEAAAAQGKFWEMADLLFTDQAKFSDALFPQLAQSLNLDLVKFTKDMEDSTIKQKIANDRAYGIRIGVNATPTFFLNGKKLNLTSFDDLKNAVAEAVK
ncbi:thioredoxin domain-containing protein [Candidatus Gottesmanbacteria bacterium]|nr:thioredoxin domain-containing protein [Candidatus Gottesmanbacteria bacterium]